MNRSIYRAAYPGEEDRRHNVALRSRFSTAWRLLDQTQNESDPVDTTLFLVLQRMQRLYPETHADELEATLLAVLNARTKRRQKKPKVKHSVLTASSKTHHTERPA